MKSQLEIYKTDANASLEDLLIKYRELVLNSAVKKEDHFFCFGTLGNYFKDTLGSELDDNVIIEAEQILTFVYNKTFEEETNTQISLELKDRFDELIGIANALAYIIKKENRRDRVFFKDCRDFGKYLIDTGSKFVDNRSKFISIGSVAISNLHFFS